MKKLLLIVVLIIVVMSGCGQEVVETVVKDQTFKFDDFPPITIQGNDSLHESEVNLVIDHIKNQPSFLLEKVKEFVICGEENYEKYLISSTSVAFSNPNNMKIYCRVTVTNETITHELAHIFDYVDGYHYYSDSKEFQKLYKLYRGTFHFKNDKDNQYGETELDKYDIYFNTNCEEFFAECSQLYINDNEYLKKQCLAIYQYFDKLYAEY